MKTLLDIEHDGLTYRPFDKSMVDGWDTVKSGERRPHGWGKYLCVGGWVVFDENGFCVKAIHELPPQVKRALETRP